MAARQHTAEDYEGFGAPLSRHIWLKRVQWFKRELDRHMREAHEETPSEAETRDPD